MLKYLVVSLASALIGAFLVFHFRAPIEKVVTKDKIVTVTRVVKPDGTIVEKSKVEDKVISAVAKQALVRRLLGLSYNMDKEYSGSLYYRLGDTPLFIGGSISSNHVLGIGLMFEF